MIFYSVWFKSFTCIILCLSYELTQLVPLPPIWWCLRKFYIPLSMTILLLGLFSLRLHWKVANNACCFVKLPKFAYYNFLFNLHCLLLHRYNFIAGFLKSVRRNPECWTLKLQTEAFRGFCRTVWGGKKEAPKDTSK